MAMTDKTPIKVAYKMTNGFESTAYVTRKFDEDGNTLINELFNATNKYTDTPLFVMWTGHAWVEVEI